MNSEFLEFRDISKSFGAIRAVAGVSLGLKKGEFFSLLGPSGCGKTTMLRLAAGFEEPDAGRVFLDGRDITDLPPDKRKVNTIFQSYALFPHMTVRDNIAFGLTIAKRPKREIRAEVDRMLELIRMADQAGKKPDQLSGGQKQRVAVARALINRPDVLLLDEPLAALDLKLRQKMLIELDLIHDEVGITFLYVTHDQAEAMSLSDRIAVMDGGRIEQVGTPAEIYESPGQASSRPSSATPISSRGASSTARTATTAASPSPACPRWCRSTTGPSSRDSRPTSASGPRRSTSPTSGPSRRPGGTSSRPSSRTSIYLGSNTKYWVRAGSYRIQVLRQHARYFLDEKPIRWKDPCWIWWHADDGFMLDHFRKADESLLAVPPQTVGEPINEK